ncbi:MAG TPA: sodium:proton antiporter [Acidimicrobium sp.]|nr:sodium:proton antiporter [Acidimicrobium sp.]
MGATPPSVAEVTLRLKAVMDPELGDNIVDLGMAAVDSISADGVVAIAMKLTIKGCPLRVQIKKDIESRLESHPGVTKVTIDWGEMTAEERTAVMTRARWNAREQAPDTQIPLNTRILAIASGKGGVGKSSVTVNLAAALASVGHTVGVLDADIWGFSIPRMLGTDRDPVVIDNMLLPPEAWGVRCISIGYFVPEGQAVVWRGPMLHKALEQFLTDVYWDEPDFLFIDMPPGTGDIALSLSQYLPRAEVLVVTTPQEAAQKVARLSAAMAVKVNLPVRGIIENMSWFTGDDGKRYELFGKGGGQILADELNVPLLAQIPLLNALREGGDDGHPIAAVAPDSEVGKVFFAIAKYIAEDMKPKKIFSAALKVN